MTRKLNIDNGIKDWKTEHQAVTKAICNKGFSGNSSILPRSNFGVVGQESSPQSLTAYSVPRSRASAIKALHAVIEMVESAKADEPLLPFFRKGQQTT
jgi:hypothetical protein